MRKICLITCLLVFGLFGSDLRAETYKLTTGETINGELLLITANDQGIKVKVGEGDYPVVPWASFAQEDIKTFATNPKLAPFVEPFIEVSQEQKMKKTEVQNLKQPHRLVQPPRQSVIGAFFGSGVGLFVLFMIYAGGIWAGYEVAIFRAQPPALVAGLSAIPGLGFLVPIVFLCMPTRIKPGEEDVAGHAAPAEGAAAGPDGAVAVAQDDTNPMRAEGAEHPSGLHLAKQPAGAELQEKAPPAQIFQRGQFTFNKRFFETKFVALFGIVRREEDRDLIIVVKSSKGELIGNRITRVGPNELHIQVQKGPATQEVMVTFQEIQEVQLKHRGAAPV